MERLQGEGPQAHGVDDPPENEILLYHTNAAARLGMYIRMMMGLSIEFKGVAGGYNVNLD